MQESTKQREDMSNTDEQKTMLQRLKDQCVWMRKFKILRISNILIEILLFSKFVFG